MGTRAADQVGVERWRSAAACGDKRFGCLLKLAEPHVNVLKLRSRVAATSPQGRK